MRDFYADLKRKCEMLFSTLNLDILIADQDRNILLRLLQNPCPEELMTQWDSYHDEMVQALKEPKREFWHSVWDGLLIFLDLKIEITEAENLYIVVGPVLTRVVSDISIQEYLSKVALSVRTVHIIKSYIRKSPFFSLKTKNALWMIREILRYRDVDDAWMHPEKLQTIDTEITGESKPFPITNEQIILNYQAEQKWLAYIAIGDASSAKKELRYMSSNDYFVQQSPNPARVVKNLLHGMNGMCKGAAYYGGASPLSVFKVERTFSEAIEKAQSSFLIEGLFYEMVDAYCNAVLESKTANYSMPVKKAVTYILGHYGENITRKQIAQEIHYSEGHLSRMFLQETGKKINEFIYDLRIENACKLLKSNVYSVTDIALLVGFSSYSKFSVEFKRRMGMTATEYIQKR